MRAEAPGRGRGGVNPSPGYRGSLGFGDLSAIPGPLHALRLKPRRILLLQLLLMMILITIITTLNITITISIMMKFIFIASRIPPGLASIFIPNGPKI